MNEQDERAIYEWLYSELAELPQWELRKSRGLPPTAMWNGRFNAKMLPPLDMNTWHSDVLRQLNKAEVTVCFAHGQWHLDANVFVNVDPYAALLDYIKAVRS